MMIMAHMLDWPCWMDLGKEASGYLDFLLLF